MNERRCSNLACKAKIDTDAQECPVCGALLIGEVLSNRFRIETVLGHGGMGAVYRALDLTLERQVALKVLAPTAENLDESPEILHARFFHEARLAAQFNHPHIVPVLHFDSDSSLAYLVMPLLTGGTLAGALRQRRPIAPSIVLIWLRQMAAALDYAHQRPQPIIHCDVKPSNFLFHADGRLCLTDFGIACFGGKNSTEMAPWTRPGMVMGSAAYMAPEQITGHTVIASDQYSVGVILYEALTGTRPFEAADHHALLMQHIRSTPLLPGLLLPGLPTEVDEVVMRALAKKPAERFPTLEALAEAFEDALSSASAAQGAVPSLSHVTTPMATNAPSQESAYGQAASFSVPSADQRGIHLIETAPRARAVGSQLSQGAHGAEAADAGPHSIQQQRQQSRRLIALWSGLAALLLVVSILGGVSHRVGNTTNSITQITPAPSQTSFLPPTQGANPYIQTLSAAESHPLLFLDALTNNSEHWKIGHGVHFASDGLHLPSPAQQGEKQNTLQNATAQQSNLLLSSSCDVEVDIVVNHPGAIYGFGFLDADHPGHMLTLSSSGGYAVSLISPQHPNTPRQLLSGANTGLILRSGQVTHLAILIQGNQIALFLNKQFITSLLLTSNSFTSAHIFELLNLSDQGQSDGEVIFQHLSIYPV